MRIAGGQETGPQIIPKDAGLHGPGESAQRAMDRDVRPLHFDQFGGSLETAVVFNYYYE